MVILVVGKHPLSIHAFPIFFFIQPALRLAICVLDSAPVGRSTDQDRSRLSAPAVLHGGACTEDGRDVVLHVGRPRRRPHTQPPAHTLAHCPRVPGFRLRGASGSVHKHIPYASGAHAYRSGQTAAGNLPVHSVCVPEGSQYDHRPEEPRAPAESYYIHSPILRTGPEFQAHRRRSPSMASCKRVAMPSSTTKPQRRSHPRLAVRPPPMRPCCLGTLPLRLFRRMGTDLPMGRSLYST
ncbi:hypothetical protein C8Q72DRAFT_176594 [Fomitopsis betulina]|nr:hypothetical protein C8Q72DRAFT_194007 [Fomitopsis betulina]KAI0716065.1 hypothetical protein C8Q72DRAFT_176594 [Fomitopsis betulina]